MPESSTGTFGDMIGAVSGHCAHVVVVLIIFFITGAVGVSSGTETPCLQRSQTCGWARVLAPGHSSPRSDHRKRLTSTSPTRKQGRHLIISLQCALALTRGMVKAPLLQQTRCCKEVCSCHYRRTSRLILQGTCPCTTLSKYH